MEREKFKSCVTYRFGRKLWKFGGCVRKATASRSLPTNPPSMQSWNTTERIQALVKSSHGIHDTMKTRAHGPSRFFASKPRDNKEDRIAPLEWIVAQGYNVGLEVALGKNFASFFVPREAKKLKSEFSPCLFIDAPVAQLDRARLS